MSLYAPTLARQKPPRWAPVSRGLVAPEYQRFWDGLYVANLMWEGGGLTTADLAPGKKWTLSRNECLWRMSRYGSALSIIDVDDVLTYANLPLNKSTALSCVLVINVTALVGTNPGIWRSGATSTGTSFFIVQGANSLPWIRMNGTDILKPVSGTTITTGYHVIGFSYRNNDKVEYFQDGVLRQSATHATTLPNDFIYRVGWQNDTGQTVRGDYIAIYFWYRYLSPFEHAILGVDPFAPFRMAEEEVYRVPAAGGVFFPYYRYVHGG